LVNIICGYCGYGDSDIQGAFVAVKRKKALREGAEPTGEE